MVRVSIPTIKPRPPAPPNALTKLPVAQAAEHLAAFLRAGRGRTLAISGAGVSVESGIRAYRGNDGRYTNPNFNPIFYSELVEDSERGDLFRKRYWGRSFLGYPPVRDAKPNPTHIAVALLQSLGLAPGLITQNVDNLHRKALALVTAAFKSHGVSPRISPLSTIPTPASLPTPASPSPSPSGPSILELHGTLAKVHCLKHGHEASRDSWQDALAAGNPIWDAEAKWAEETGNRPRTNPDGDVELPGADYANFHVPECSKCIEQGETHSIIKPNVIFFGETLPPKVKAESFEMIEAASSLLVLGSSLATYSAYRLIKAAREADKPVLMVSLGPSRADELAGVEKMERSAGPVLRAFLDDYLATHSGPEIDAARSVLDSGVVVEIPKDSMREDIVSSGNPAGPGPRLSRILGERDPRA